MGRPRRSCNRQSGFAVVCVALMFASLAQLCIATPGERLNIHKDNISERSNEVKRARYDPTRRVGTILA